MASLFNKQIIDSSLCLVAPQSLGLLLDYTGFVLYTMFMFGDRGFQVHDIYKYSLPNMFVHTIIKPMPY